MANLLKNTEPRRRRRRQRASRSKFAPELTQSLQHRNRTRLFAVKCGQLEPPPQPCCGPAPRQKQKHQIGSSTLHPGPPPEPPPWMTDTDVVRTSLRPAARLPLYLWLEARSARRSCNQILVRELQKRLEYRLSKLDW